MRKRERAHTSGGSEFKNGTSSRVSVSIPKIGCEPRRPPQNGLQAGTGCRRPSAGRRGCLVYEGRASAHVERDCRAHDYRDGRCDEPHHISPLNPMSRLCRPYLAGMRPYTYPFDLEHTCPGSRIEISLSPCPGPVGRVSARRPDSGMSRRDCGIRGGRRPGWVVRAGRGVPKAGRAEDFAAHPPRAVTEPA